MTTLAMRPSRPLARRATTFIDERESRRRLLRVLIFVTYFIGLYYMYLLREVESGLTAAAVALIVVTALVPAFIWCLGWVPGLPIFPLYAVTFTWTFALPLLGAQARVAQYTPEDHLYTGYAVSFFLVTATAVWIIASRGRRRRPVSERVLKRDGGTAFLIGVVVLDTLMLALQNSGRLPLPEGIISIVRALLDGVTSVAAFIIPYLWGRRQLRPSIARLAMLALTADAIFSLSRLFLFAALTLVGLALLGFTLGRGRVRLYIVLLALGPLIVLHYGKTAMRERYWHGVDAETGEVTPWGGKLTIDRYPALLEEWVTYAMEEIVADKPKTEGFAERSGLVHLFLLAHYRHENGLPHLNGATYAPIPLMFVPRLLMPSKPASHEGTSLLNIHYGLQRREDTYTTTIAWGMFNEAYANFGIWGLAGLAIVFGTVLGAIAKWTRDAPPLSGRFQIAVLVLSAALQTEFSAGVMLTSLFQSVIAVLIFLVAFGRRERQPRGRAPVASARPIHSHPLLPMAGQSSSGLS